MTKKEVEKLGYIDSVNAAKLIGCSIKSLYNATAAKKISYYKLGQFMYFKPEDVEMYKKELEQKNCELIKIEKKTEHDLMAAEHFKKVGDVVEHKSYTDLELTDGKKILRQDANTSFINAYLDNWQKTFNSILEEMRHVEVLTNESISFDLQMPDKRTMKESIENASKGIDAEYEKKIDDFLDNWQDNWLKNFNSKLEEIRLMKEESKITMKESKNKKWFKKDGYDWNAIIGHIKSLTTKEYSAIYVNKVINGYVQSYMLIPILEEMGLMKDYGQRKLIKIEKVEPNLI